MMKRLAQTWLLCVAIGSVVCFCSSGLAQSADSSSADSDATRWYKGNLHTHSLWSDGNDFPDMITKWFADRDYHFLAMTDHNILSRGERWMPLATIEGRGGEDALPKYLAAFGEEWVETRVDAEGEREVRLKTLEEYRVRFEEPGKFMLMTGEEISDRVDGLPIHLNATNLVELLRPVGGTSVREVITNNLKAAMAQAEKHDREILIHLNHPNFGWAITAEDLAFVTLERFFEVYNGHPAVNHLGDENRPSIERMWDIANTIRIDKLKSAPLYGLATDDCHYYHGRPGSQPGRGWVMVRADELTPTAILRSIKRGDFYASSGVTLTDVQFDPQRKQIRIEIDAQPGETYTTHFIGTRQDYDRTTTPRVDEEGTPMRTTHIYSPDVGQTLATVEGTTAQYTLQGDELYVRAMIISSADHVNPSFPDQKKQAWTQPVGWEPHLK